MPPQRVHLGLQLLVVLDNVDPLFFGLLQEFRRPVPPQEDTFPELQALWGHGGPDDKAVGLIKMVLELAQLFRPVHPGPEGHGLLRQLQFSPFIFVVPQESPKLGGVGMFKQQDEEVLVELEGAGELPMDLPHTFQEEQEHWGLPLLLAVGIG